VLGATKVGVDVPAPTNTLPEVSVAAPVPPLATVRVPEVPATIGKSVALVSVPLIGVPNALPVVTAPSTPNAVLAMAVVSASRRLLISAITGILAMILFGYAAG
jgi:hypothetical protein